MERTVAQIRTDLGLSQEGLAAQMGVHRTTVMRWENGSPMPTLARRLLDKMDRERPAKGRKTKAVA